MAMSKSQQKNCQLCVLWEEEHWQYLAFICLFILIVFWINAASSKTRHYFSYSQKTNIFISPPSLCMHEKECVDMLFGCLRERGRTCMHVLKNFKEKEEGFFFV